MQRPNSLIKKWWPVRNRTRAIAHKTQLPKRKCRGLRRWRKILRRQLEACQPKFSLQHMLLSWLGAFIGIAALAYLTASTPYPFIAAPFGATAVLVFGVPDSPLAQPRNIIGGNLIAAIICVICVALWGTAPF